MMSNATSEKVNCIASQHRYMTAGSAYTQRYAFPNNHYDAALAHILRAEHFPQENLATPETNRECIRRSIGRDANTRARDIHLQ